MCKSSMFIFTWSNAFARTFSSSRVCTGQKVIAGKGTLSGSWCRVTTLKNKGLLENSTNDLEEGYLGQTLKILKIDMTQDSVLIANIPGNGPTRRGRGSSDFPMGGGVRVACGPQGGRAAQSRQGGGQPPTPKARYDYQYGCHHCPVGWRFPITINDENRK